MPRMITNRNLQPIKKGGIHAKTSLQAEKTTALQKAEINVSCAVRSSAVGVFLRLPRAYALWKA